MQRTRFLSTVAAISMAAAVSACATHLERRGNLPDPDEIAQIHPGKTTKTQVEKLLGSPSSTGVFDANSWYYISKRTKRVAFFEPDVLDQQVYIVRFHKDGVVKDVGHMTLKDARNVEPAPGKTPAPGRHLTFLEQLIGNIGSKFGGGS